MVLLLLLSLSLLVSQGSSQDAFDANRLKGLQPDYWPPNEIAKAGAGRVAMNFVWEQWEPEPKAAPCDDASIEYERRCYIVNGPIDTQVHQYFDLGVDVTAILYGTPAWAVAEGCLLPPDRSLFCAPTEEHAQDYGTFAGALSRRYNGQDGRPKVSNFVILNEVNTAEWFNTGCGKTEACDPTKWVETYAQSYAAAYDSISKEQQDATVMTSFTHHFAKPTEVLKGPSPILAIETFLPIFDQAVGQRDWRVAQHPYPPDLFEPVFGADDYPKVTFGNVGKLVGYLAQQFPSKPIWTNVQLTECGINGLAPRSDAEKQNQKLCEALANIVGTPGVTNFIYHRRKDFEVEIVGLGLMDKDDHPRPAWDTWVGANKHVDTALPPVASKPSRLLRDTQGLVGPSCGFENLPSIKLTRYYNPSTGKHWQSTRVPPSGFNAEQEFMLLRDVAAGEENKMTMLWECRVGSHNLLSTSQACEDLEPMGPVGMVWKDEASSNGESPRIPLYRCRIGKGSDHFITRDSGCEGAGEMEDLLGYVAV